MSPHRNNEEEPEIITDSARIVSILQRLYQQRGLLSITFPTAVYGNNRGDSLIVEVDSDNNRLLLNRLYPERAHNTLLKEKKLEARAFIQGVEIKFSSELKELIDEAGDLYYMLDIPKRLSYHQRRSSHRSDTSQATPIPVTLELEDRTTIEGVIEDISIGGMSIYFTTNLPQTFQLHATIPRCRFRLPNGEPVACKLSMRFIQHNYENSPPRIGAEFEELERAQHRLISQFVMSLDREKRRTSID